MIRLTPRQRQILSRSLQGMTAREIGKAVGCSTRTVESHLQAIRGQFRAPNMVAVAVAIYRDHALEATP